MADPIAVDRVVDFHGHWFPPGLVGAAPSSLSPAMRDAWPLLVDLDAQLEADAAAGIDVRVVNAALSSVVPAARVPLESLPSRLNDALAEAVATHGPRLAALATVDAYRGDAGAEEARRAIDELGLPGIVVDAAQGERLLSAPEARPTLELAAERGIAVFAHPVTPPQLSRRYAEVAGVGTLLARGAESALSTLALLASGVLAELPGLRLVIASIGAPALLLSAFLDGPDDAPAPPSAARSQLHVDTMGFDPTVVRYLVDVLGPEHVLIGSDWPIMWRSADRERVAETLDRAGVAGADRAAIAAGNARRLLG